MDSDDCPQLWLSSLSAQCRTLHLPELPSSGCESAEDDIPAVASPSGSPSSHSYRDPASPGSSSSGSPESKRKPFQTAQAGYGSAQRLAHSSVFDVLFRPSDVHPGPQHMAATNDRNPFIRQGAAEMQPGHPDVSSTFLDFGTLASAPVFTVPQALGCSSIVGPHNLQAYHVPSHLLEKEAISAGVSASVVGASLATSARMISINKTSSSSEDKTSTTSGSDSQAKNGDTTVCAKCDLDCGTHSALRKHIRIHTGERPYACQVCDRAFARKSHLKVHKRVHSGERPYSCEICGKTFTQGSNLKAHLRIHTGDKPYECGECGRRFTVSSSLKAHLLTHQSDPRMRRRFSCSLCGKTFAWKANVTKHQRAVHGITTRRSSTDGNTSESTQHSSSFEDDSTSPFSTPRSVRPTRRRRPGPRSQAQDSNDQPLSHVFTPTAWNVTSARLPVDAAANILPTGFPGQ